LAKKWLGLCTFWANFSQTHGADFSCIFSVENSEENSSLIFPPKNVAENWNFPRKIVSKNRFSKKFRGKFRGKSLCTKNRPLVILGGSNVFVRELAAAIPAVGSFATSTFCPEQIRRQGRRSGENKIAEIELNTD
jgi:hypothetical protein